MSGRRRIKRVNHLLREELARLIRFELKDPRVSPVTVTGVEATSDLKYATVYVRTLGGEQDIADAIRGLESAEGYLRKVLGRELRLRRIPELSFREDSSLEHAIRIEALLDEALGPGRDGGDAD